MHPLSLEIAMGLKEIAMGLKQIALVDMTSLRISANSGENQLGKQEKLKFILSFVKIRRLSVEKK